MEDKNKNDNKLDNNKIKQLQILTSLLSIIVLALGIYALFNPKNKLILNIAIIALGLLNLVLAYSKKVTRTKFMILGHIVIGCLAIIAGFASFFFKI